MFVECGDSCLRTCGDLLNSSSPCETECVEGCQCPAGQVMDTKTDRCVESSECGCKYEDRVFANGQEILKGCNVW